MRSQHSTITPTASDGPAMWTAADAYEGFMGRWSRRVATGFLDALAVPAGVRWLDVGCGVGTLTAEILDGCAPAAVLGIDRSAQFLRHAAGRVLPTSVVHFAQAEAEALPYPSVFDATVSGLTINFLSDPGPGPR